MLQGIFNTTVTIKRRLSISAASRDVLNNPIYGNPTNSPWSTVYSNVPARLAFGSKPLQFAQTGERVTPSGVLYIPPTYILYHEDRVLTSDGIEYVVVSVVPGYIMNTVIDHWEIILALP